jgi:hypothetical protein
LRRKSSASIHYQSPQIWTRGNRAYEQAILVPFWNMLC